MFRLYKYPSAAVCDFTVKSASDDCIIKALPVRCHTIHSERELCTYLLLLNAKTYSSNNIPKYLVANSFGRRRAILSHIYVRGDGYV